jgi:omega-amidase
LLLPYSSCAFYSAYSSLPRLLFLFFSSQENEVSFADALLYPGAFNMVTGPAHWELLQRARAVDCQSYVVSCSPSRIVQNEKKEDEGVATTEKKKKTYPPYTAWGHSSVVNPWGEVIATTDEKEGVVVASLDWEKLDETRKSIPTSMQKRPDVYNKKR